MDILNEGVDIIDNVNVNVNVDDDIHIGDRMSRDDIINDRDETENK